MNSLFDSQISRESISNVIGELSRKYFDLPDSHREKMSEQDVRDYFVTPLLEALGWGVVDPRERSAEKYLPRQGYSDYELCLPLGSNPSDPYAPVVYVEAKRFGSLSRLEPDLFGRAKRSDADLQAIEYADQFNSKRGEKIGWAILTNFEVLRVWDTRRNVLVEEVEWFTSLKSERTLEVLYLLSRDQVAQDPSFKNLSAYRKLPDIDERFLAKLNEWRESLADAIWNHKPNRLKLGSSLSEQQSALRIVVQRTLDRLIVIRTAEDRGLLPSQYRLQEMVTNFGGQNAVPLRLLENIQRNTFTYFDHHYNSKLFGPHLADSMEVHNVPIRRIIDEMCTASFVSMNADILGATYEQYLGQTLEINPETDTPRLATNFETRHAQGSYYTPRYIVQAIVDGTLGRYLYGSGAGAVSGLGSSRKRITDIQELSILDPACGSGSFLIYVFDVLLEFYLGERARIRREIDEHIDLIVSSGVPRLAAEAQYDPRLIELKGELELTRLAQAKIIERHLYGVDLDPQAAEVASMNLLLKALTRDQRLPRILGDNIKVGNSLVSGAAIEEPLEQHRNDLDELLEIRSKVRDATMAASENSDDRQQHEATLDQLEIQFRDRADRLNAQLNCDLLLRDDDGWFADTTAVRPFNWQVEFPEKFKAGSAERGFTLVIGNPPYVGFHGFKDQKEYLRDTYFAASGKFDLYIPFLERGIRLTKSRGELSYICPSTFMKRGFGRKMRRFILDQTEIRSLHDFQHIQVFRNVLNYTCIPALIRATAKGESVFEYSEGGLDAERRPYVQAKLTEGPWIFRFGSDEALVQRIKQESKFIELGDSSISTGVAEGIVTGCNSVLLIPQSEIAAKRFETEYLKKCLRGEDVKRYSVKWSGFYVLYPYERMDGGVRVIEEEALRGRCPNLYAYLLASSEKLRSRKYMEGTSKKWYELWCQRNLDDHATSKVVVPELADRSQFAFVSPDFFYVDTTCGLGINEKVDPWYVIGILNSRPAELLYRKTTVPKANGFLIYKTMFLNPFRIPDPARVPGEIVEKISRLAERVQQNNAHSLQVEKAFALLVDMSLPAATNNYQNFQRDYYDVMQNWSDRKFLVADALQLKDPIAGIRVEVKSQTNGDQVVNPKTLCLSYKSESSSPWRPLLQLQADNAELALFLVLAIRRFLDENSRKSVWKLNGKSASKRTVDVLLQSLVLPVWNFGAGTWREVTRQKISDIICGLRQQFPNCEINPAVLDAANVQAEREIDALAFSLYGMEEEAEQLLETELE